jgi:hypothetical protein
MNIRTKPRMTLGDLHTTLYTKRGPAKNEPDRRHGCANYEAVASPLMPVRLISVLYFLKPLDERWPQS